MDQVPRFHHYEAAAVLTSLAAGLTSGLRVRAALRRRLSQGGPWSGLAGLLQDGGEGELVSPMEIYQVKRRQGTLELLQGERE